MSVAARHEKKLSIKALDHENEKELKTSEKIHVTVLRREMSNVYKASRDDSKVLFQLEDQLKTSERDRDILKKEAEERLSLELEKKRTKRLAKQKFQLIC